MDIADIRDIGNLPDMFPVKLDITAAVPITLPVNVEMGPQVDEGPDVVLAGRDMEVDDTDVRDTQLLTDGRPMMFGGSAAGPLSLSVVVDTATQIEAGWETTSTVVPLGDECGRPVGWLDSECDCCVVEEVVLDPEKSPIVSVRSAAAPTFLPAMSDEFSLAVLAGSLLRQTPWQL